MSDIEIYESPDGEIRLNVQLEDETVWLTQAQIAQLFGVNSQAITKHLGNIFEEEELDPAATCSKMEQVRQEGSRQGRSGLKFERQVGPCGAVDIHVGYHLAAALIGRHALEQLPAAVQHPYARGAVHLMG